MTKPKHIQIYQDGKFSLESELLPILEKLMPIKFSVGKQSETKAQGAIFTNSEDRKNETIPVPSLTVALSTGESTSNLQQVEVSLEFADEPDVPFPFRGRKVRTNLSQHSGVLTVNAGEKVLASNEQGPVWLVSEMDGVKRYRSALALPRISSGQNFNDVFNDEFFLEMFVLLQFIREICADTAYQPPPLRASFIIDDPNLHWPRYGFFGYQEIIALANAENFHVSFATIPLDAWYTHSPTADIFRKNSQRISLLIHGNNHAKEELALDYSEDARSALLGQAITRITRLENKSGVPVCRVMVPPHGACSNDMLKELPLHGFESACISSSSLRYHNPDKPWVKTLGFFPSELIEGCPVLPRWGLTGNVENTLLIAAYLGQPMVLRGHHQDLKNGGGGFIKFAKFINSLGDVFWGNMTDLSRLNYQWQLYDNKALVRPFGQNIVLKLPKEANEVIIASPDGLEIDTWKIYPTKGAVHEIMSGQGFHIANETDGEIFISRNNKQYPYTPRDPKPTSPKLILRRLLTEVRDRLLLSD